MNLAVEHQNLSNLLKLSANAIRKVVPQLSTEVLGKLWSKLKCGGSTKVCGKIESKAEIKSKYVSGILFNFLSENHGLKVNIIIRRTLGYKNLQDIGNPAPNMQQDNNINL